MGATILNTKLRLTCAAALLGIATTALAQPTYPNKPIRLVVPFPPGGAVDIMARILSDKMTQRLGQQIVIDNRPGANGNIGMDIVAKAPPDGYNAVIATVGTWA